MNIVILDNFDADFSRWSSDALIKLLILIAGFLNMDEIQFVTTKSYYDSDDDEQLVVGSDAKNAEQWVFRSVHRFNQRMRMVHTNGASLAAHVAATCAPETTLLVSAAPIAGYRTLFDSTFGRYEDRPNKVFALIQQQVPPPFRYASDDCAIFLDFDGVILRGNNWDAANATKARPLAFFDPSTTASRACDISFNVPTRAWTCCGAWTSRTRGCTCFPCACTQPKVERPWTHPNRRCWKAKCEQ